MKKIRGFTAYCAAFVFALFLSGCAGTVKNMQAVPPDRVVSAPVQGKSLVVFMRPSGMAYAIQSSVFDVTGTTPSLVGILAAKKKVAYQLEPGQHTFMVVGESGDFMSAELEANKTYYALVTPRMGVWKARFSLKPVTADELKSAEFTKWLADCEWVEKAPESDAWASDNMADIQSKQKEYYTDWMKKEASERPKLLPKDGK